MTTYEEERELNWAAYAELEEDLLRHHRGKYAAIAGGRLVKLVEIADGDDMSAFDEARAAVKGKHKHYLAFQVGTDPRMGPIRHGARSYNSGR